MRFSDLSARNAGEVTQDSPEAMKAALIQLQKINNQCAVIINSSSSNAIVKRAQKRVLQVEKEINDLLGQHQEIEKNKVNHPYRARLESRQNAIQKQIELHNIEHKDLKKELAIFEQRKTAVFDNNTQIQQQLDTINNPIVTIAVPGAGDYKKQFVVN